MFSPCITVFLSTTLTVNRPSSEALTPLKTEFESNKKVNTKNAFKRNTRRDKTVHQKQDTNLKRCGQEKDLTFYTSCLLKEFRSF